MIYLFSATDVYRTMQRYIEGGKSDPSSREQTLTAHLNSLNYTEFFNYTSECSRESLVTDDDRKVELNPWWGVGWG